MFEGETKKMKDKEKERRSYWNPVFTEQYQYKTMPENVWLNSFDIPFDHFPPKWVALVERQDQPKYLCLWASFPSIIWRNSRWGCRSVTLQQKRLRLCPIYCSWRFLFFFVSHYFSFLSSPSGVNIYGLVKPTWNRELTNISSVKVLSERP